MSELVDDVGFMGVGDEESVGDTFDDYGATAYQAQERPQESPVDEHKTERKPETSHLPARRDSGADLLTILWGGAGMYLVRSGTDVPVGRMMQFQSTLAGKQFDDMIAGTWMDKLLLQPMVKAHGKAEGLGAVILGPVLIGLYEHNPDMGTLLEGFIRAVVETSLTEMAPVIRKQQAKTRKSAEAMAEVSKLFNLPPDVDPIDAILDGIFRQDVPPPPDDEEEGPTNES